MTRNRREAHAALGPQRVTTTVVVSGLVPGNPPLLAWYRRLKRAAGRQKIHMQRVEVPDRNLFERLRREVREGDEITITIVTDWSAHGAPTHLESFAHAPATSSTPSMSPARLADRRTDES